MDINQYINIAVAEKLATRRTAQAFFAERAKKSDASKTLEILELAGSETEMEIDNKELLISDK